MTAAAVFLFLIPCLLSLVITGIARRMALRWGLMDAPGHRKVHTVATPRNGGIGIFWGLAAPILAGIAAITFLPADALIPPDAPNRELLLKYLGGMLAHRPLALLLVACTLGIHLVGLLDDRKALPPWPKLVAQLGFATALVFTGEWLEPGAFRVGTALDTLLPAGWVLSAALSILWITALTNAFNFLDNMDGLSAGVAFLCAAMFLIAAILNGQLFVAGLLLLFMGSVLGFLCYNFPPASIFMGDGGSMILGFFLSALTIRTTFYHSGTNAGQWYALFMPLIVMAVPLYDFIIVSVLRIARGRSPMTGDTNHFSHRLVRHGFSKRGAVLLIYAVTLATGISAPLLTRVDEVGAILIALQVLAMLVVIGFLERVGEHTQ